MYLQLDLSFKCYLLYSTTYQTIYIWEYQRVSQTYMKPNMSQCQLLNCDFPIVRGWIVSLQKSCVEVLTLITQNVNLFGNRAIAIRLNCNKLNWGHTGVLWAPHPVWRCHKRGHLAIHIHTEGDASEDEGRAQADVSTAKECQKLLANN